jgi:hypothetical protein
MIPTLIDWLAQLGAMSQVDHLNHGSHVDQEKSKQA